MPIGSPSSAVKPIDESTLCPSTSAHIDAPDPRCAATTLPAAISGACVFIAPAMYCIRQAVEAVAPHAFLIQRVGDGEPVRHGGVAAMERGVEAGDLRHAGEPLAQPLQHVERRRVVQRGQRRNRLDPRQGRVIDQHGTIQVGTAMHDAVTERRDFAGQRAIRQLGQRLHRRMRIGGRHRASCVVLPSAPVIFRCAEPPIPSTSPDSSGGASGSIG